MARKSLIISLLALFILLIASGVLNAHPVHLSGRKTAERDAVFSNENKRFGFGLVAGASPLPLLAFQTEFGLKQAGVGDYPMNIHADVGIAALHYKYGIGYSQEIIGHYGVLVRYDRFFLDTRSNGGGKYDFMDIMNLYLSKSWLTHGNEIKHTLRAGVSVLLRTSYDDMGSFGPSLEYSIILR